MTGTPRSRFGARQGIMVDSLNARNCDHQRIHNQDVGNCKTVRPSITHIVDFQGGTEGDVVQSREAAPHDDVFVVLPHPGIQVPLRFVD